MKFELYSPMALHELGQRDNQEDSIFPRLGNINANDRLFLVCDGMGGHEKGEVASAAVANAVSKWIDDNISSDGVLDDETIEEAIRFARKQLDRFDDSSLKKMGTTLTMVSFHNGGVTMGHIGDSRIYHIRPSQRRILYKTIDHSLVYDLFMAGDITYEEMATSSRRNVITRALMPGEENEVNIDLTHTTDVKPGDYFYLCSDGMLEQMSDNELVNLISGDDSDQAKIEKLKKATANNKDNHSAILLKVKGVSSEEGDQQMPNDEKVSHYNEVALLAKMAANAANAAQAPEMPQAPAPAMPSAPAKPQAAPSMPQQQPVSNMAPNYGEARERPIRRRAMDEDPYEMQPDTGGGSNWLKLLLISMLAIAVIAGAVYIFMDKILTMFGASADTIAYAREYMDIVLPGMFMTTVTFNLTGLIRATGYPKKSMWIMDGNGINGLKRDLNNKQVRNNYEQLSGNKGTQVNPGPSESSPKSQEPIPTAPKKGPKSSTELTRGEHGSSGTK